MAEWRVARTVETRVARRAVKKVVMKVSSTVGRTAVLKGERMADSKDEKSVPTMVSLRAQGWGQKLAC